MATPQQREATQAQLLYYWALAVAADSIEDDAEALWGDVPPTGGARFTEAWFSGVARLLRRRRGAMRQIALTFYRYQRALITGSTIALPGQAPGTTTIDQLREEFEKAVDAVDPAGPDPIRRPVVPDNSDGDVPVTKLSGLDKLISELDEQQEEDIEDSLRKGPRSLSKKLAKLEKITVPDDPEVDEAHGTAGSVGAAHAARILRNESRLLIHEVVKKDEKALGFARVSTTGTPCGFCAMLISRGPIYKSRRSAGDGYNGSEYHANDNCIAVPVYSMEQYNSDPTFDLNRQYAKEWPEVTKGKTDPLSVWRKHIREQQEPSPKKPAQAAA